MLTAKQSRFIDEYMVDRNGAAAAVRAGYSVKCARQAAHETLSNPDVLATLRAKQQVEADRLGITRQGVIKAFLDSFELAKEQSEPAAMIAAVRQIGLMLGFYSPHGTLISNTREGNVDIAQIDKMSDTELFNLVRDNCQN